MAAADYIDDRKPFSEQPLWADVTPLPCRGEQVTVITRI